MLLPPTIRRKGTQVWKSLFNINSRPLHHRETRKPGRKSDRHSWPFPTESHILRQGPYNHYSLPGGCMCGSQRHPCETGGRKTHTNLDIATGCKPFPYPNIRQEIPYFEPGIPSHIPVDFCRHEVTNPYFRSGFFAPLRPLSRRKTMTISRHHYKPHCAWYSHPIVVNQPCCLPVYNQRVRGHLRAVLWHHPTCVSRQPHETWCCSSYSDKIFTCRSSTQETQTGLFEGGNLLSFLLRYSTRPYEWSTKWESNSLVQVC